MDTFLIGFKQELDDGEVSTRLQKAVPIINIRNYLENYFNFRFTSTEIDSEGRPVCVVCSKTSAADSMNLTN